MTQRPNTIEDFWKFVDVRGDDECWNWLGCKHPSGYGLFRLSGKQHRSHRIACSTSNDIPEGMTVLHSCDNPSCCNPAHLSVGTQADNVKDMINKGRQRSVQGQNHPMAVLNESKVRFIRKSSMPQARLAEIFGVTQVNISRIKTGKTWKHVK